jgi:hypothetical protein
MQTFCLLFHPVKYATYYSKKCWILPILQVFLVFLDFFLAKKTGLDDIKLVSIDTIFHDLQRYLKFNNIKTHQEQKRSSKNPIPIHCKQPK